MGSAHSSPGRVLGNPAPRDRIGQCYPVGKDARLIHPYRMEQIDSVKINPSLVMMRECLWCVWKISLRLTGWIFSLPIRSHNSFTRKGDKNFALALHLEHGFSVCCKLSALRELLWDHVVVIWSECFGNKAWAEWKSLKIACLIMCTSFKRLKFHPGTFSISKSKVLIIWSMLEIVPHAHFSEMISPMHRQAVVDEKPFCKRNRVRSAR